MSNPLNSAAGHVPVPENPRETALAIRAGNIVWRAFPYFGFRYGNRGRRFAESDAAYFLTLLGYDQSTIDHQVAWTSSVLAQRGMPSYLLELQLRVLARVLRRHFKGSARFDPLVVAADRLRDKRRAFIADDELTLLSQRFAARAGFPGHPLALGVGLMIGSAAADETNGSQLAVTSIEAWLTDPSIFPEQWSQAVKDAVKRARLMCGKRM